MAGTILRHLRASSGAVRAALSRLPVHASALLRHRRRWLVLLLLLAGLVAALRLGRPSVDHALTTLVRKGDLVVQVSASGILKPARSITYRSPLAGREAEITMLAPEGTLVGEGDLVVRLDTTGLQADLLRAVQDARQAELDLKVAEVERQDALGQIESLREGEGALGVAETQAALKRSERNVARLRQEYESLKPLLERGFVTRDEFDRSAAELEQAEVELALARRKAEVQTTRTLPREKQRAQLQLEQRVAQIENIRARVQETAGRVAMLRAQIEGASIYARAGGLVVYEDYLGASPRRKIRVGDRVTASQGLVTIPEVQRMVVEASVAEGEMHRVAPGQPATVRLDAFPDLVLNGRASRVGTLARASVGRPWEEKRFDLVVELDPTDAPLRPEMTARADVRVGELRDVLLLPINAVFERSGSYVCHVVRLFGVDTRSVSLGESNDRFVVVLEGLHEGERVALTDLSADTPAPGTGAPVPQRVESFGSGAASGSRLAPR